MTDLVSTTERDGLLFYYYSVGVETDSEETEVASVETMVETVATDLEHHTFMVN